MSHLQRRPVYAIFFLLIMLLIIYKRKNIQQYLFTSSYDIATEKLMRVFGDRDPVPLITLLDQETTLYQPTNLCKMNNERGDMPCFLYMVISAPQNQDLRKFVRKNLLPAFQNPTITRGKSVKVLFFIGLPQEDLMKWQIFKEAKEFDDIIIEDFQESYFNLTLKSMRMLKWYNINCSKSRYLIKADDDMHLNPKLFFLELNRLTKDQIATDDLIAGHPLSDNIALRDPDEKWFIPYSMWPESTYPEYASLGLYVLSRSTTFKIYQASIQNKIPLFVFEDIYVNGIIGNRVLGIKSQRIKGFVTWDAFDILSCDISRDISVTFVTGHTLQKKLNYLNCLTTLIKSPNTDACSPSKPIEYFCSSSSISCRKPKWIDLVLISLLLLFFQYTRST